MKLEWVGVLRCGRCARGSGALPSDSQRTASLWDASRIEAEINQAAATERSTPQCATDLQ